MLLPGVACKIAVNVEDGISKILHLERKARGLHLIAGANERWQMEFVPPGKGWAIG